MSRPPLVSFIVLAYRQEEFIREAVRSALAQSYEQLEIILSDDASPDLTFEIIKEEVERYRGPHRVLLNRNSANLGLAGNLNKAVQLSSGELLVLQGGDDISIPTRTIKLVERWIRNWPRPELVYSDVATIAADGSVLSERKGAIPITTVEALIRGDWFIAGGCAAAYSRSLFEKYGPLNPDVQYEDYVLTFRALLGTGCIYIDEPLVYYRIHELSIVQTIMSFGKTRSAQAKRAKQAVAEEEERLRAWDLSGKSSAALRWRLARNLAHARIDARSSTSSQLRAFACVAHAIASARPRAAWRFFRRDVLLRGG